jgi:hypothetical protein
MLARSRRDARVKAVRNWGSCRDCRALGLRDDEQPKKQASYYLENYVWMVAKPGIGMLQQQRYARRISRTHHRFQRVTHKHHSNAINLEPLRCIGTLSRSFSPSCKWKPQFDPALALAPCSAASGTSNWMDEL